LPLLGAVLAGVVATAVAYPFDRVLSGAVSGRDVRDAINSALDALGPLAAGLTLVALSREARPGDWGRHMAAVVFAILLTIGVTHGLKFAAGRARPNADVSQSVARNAFTFDPFCGRKGWDSLPSGHTSHVVSVALALGRFFPHGRAYYFLMAAVVAVERIPTGWHYVSDLLAGAIVAVICFRIVDRWFGEPAPRHLQRAPDA
jgi:membrane-associated phospholipid phosphatase